LNAVAISDAIVKDLALAMKSGDKVGLSVLRMLKSDLKYKQIELGHELSDEECIAVLSTALKKRSEAVESFQKAGRQDLAAAELAEIAVIKKYMPAELDDENLLAMIRSAIAECQASTPADIGAVMKILMPKVRGRADGRRVNELVRKSLGG